MKNSITDVIVVGAGHAGLSASYYLKKNEVDHLVFERGKAGDSWLSQRWDSFTFNSPNKLNVLPGDQHDINKPDGFSLTKEFIFSLEKYIDTYKLPIIENTRVISIDKDSSSGLFNVTVSRNNRIEHYPCGQVIIASGAMSERSVPSFAFKISPAIKQLHTVEYRNPSLLPEGAVLVAGSGQSGCQIVEDLLDAGRKVFFSTSAVSRIPRRYRGKDIMDWLTDMKFFEVRTEEITDPQMLYMKPPQLTGTGGGNRTISLQSLAKKGAVILGKTETAAEKQFTFQPNADIHVQFADGFSKKVKGMIDEFIAKTQLTAPPAEFDPEDEADPDASCASKITSLNLEEHNIKTVIWATGFSANFSYIKLPVFDDMGNPKHQQGVSDVKGLYFLGLPWLRKRKSITLFGIKEDAEFIFEKVYRYSRKNNMVDVN